MVLRTSKESAGMESDLDRLHDVVLNLPGRRSRRARLSALPVFHPSPIVPNNCPRRLVFSSCLFDNCRKEYRPIDGIVRVITSDPSAEPRLKFQHD